MLELNIPGKGQFRIKFIVSDLNGTLSMDGQLDPEIITQVQELQHQGLKFYLLSADTRGKLDELAQILGVIPRKLAQVHNLSEASEKAQFVKQLGSNSVIAIGNGENDYLMLKEARIGIVVLGSEGTSIRSLMNADICVTSPKVALNLLLNPINLIATLRN
ncbi:MAG: HAD family hydrolase [Candidatus Helarchaeota archaeon]